MREEFGPVRKQSKAHPDVPFANAFIGNYIRNELLSREGLSAQILNETVDFYLPMVELPGTLWENMTAVASCNHGFASHIAHVLYRDVLGVYNISPTEKEVTLRMIDSGLEHCKGSIPVGEESVDIEWRKENDKFEVTLSLPDGYDYKMIPTDSKVRVRCK
jgi:alpha-L-rhamnosidase